MNEFIPPKDRLHVVIIEKLSDRLCGKSFNWPCIGLKEGFCFELLNRYIEKIGTLSLDALDKYYQIIQLLCKPCQWYVQQYHDSATEKIINMYAEETSTVMSMSLVVSLRAKYFKHMKTIHKELLSWETRLQRQDVTYSEIDNYSKKVAVIQKVANTMCVPNVVVVEVHKVKHLYDDQLEMLKKSLFYSDKNGLW